MHALDSILIASNFFIIIERFFMKKFLVLSAFCSCMFIYSMERTNSGLRDRLSGIYTERKDNKEYSLKNGPLAQFIYNTICDAQKIEWENITFEKESSSSCIKTTITLDRAEMLNIINQDNEKEIKKAFNKSTKGSVIKRKNLYAIWGKQKVNEILSSEDFAFKTKKDQLLALYVAIPQEKKKSLKKNSSSSLIPEHKIQFVHMHENQWKLILHTKIAQAQ